MDKTFRTAALLSAFALLFQPSAQAQNTVEQPFRGHFVCKEHNVHLCLDLYEATLEAPGFAFLGKLNGYMNGSIYGTWMLTRHETADGKALLRFANDIGSDTQDVELTLTSDSTFQYRALGSNAVRRAVGRKLVKTEGKMNFVRKRP